MITADPQLDDVKTALKLGAYDFIGKPLDFEELHVTIQNALEASRLRTEVKSLRGEVRRNTGYHEVVAVSPKTMELMSFVQKVAASEATTILIQGESGTGKDLIAKTIHYDSSRNRMALSSPSIVRNSRRLSTEAERFGHERGAFTDAKQMKKGLFETANGGTLFLDEIGELSPLLQAKLLRVLRIRSSAASVACAICRSMCASSRPPTEIWRRRLEGHFRQDLYYRLAIIAIFIPPLRERTEDILPLVDFFIDWYNRQFKKAIRGISPETRRLLLAHNWPGNVPRAEEFDRTRHDS